MLAKHTEAHVKRDVYHAILSITKKNPDMETYHNAMAEEESKIRLIEKIN